MSAINVNSITGRTGTHGPVLTGVTTVTGGTLNTAALNVTGAASFSGNVSIAGTLSYEDVTDIDSVGIITAQSGIHVSGGKIGVGVASPSQMMEITNTGSTGSQIQLRDTSTGTAIGDGVRIGYNGTGAQVWNFENTFFRIATNDTERLRITSDGKVGVGIAAPNVFGVHANNSSNSVYFKADSGAVSTVYGSATALSTGVLGTFTNHALAFYTNSAEKLRVDSDGNVLVGTTDATIYNNGDSDSEGIVLRGGEVIDIARKGDLQLTLNRQTNDGFHVGFFRSGSPKSYIATRNDAFCIDVNSSERLRIDSSGRLLLGTTTEGEATADNFTIADSGHCGITLRSGDDDVGTIFFSDGTSGDAEYEGYVQYDHSGNYMKFATNHVERLRITSTGDLGVNIANPLAQLHVNLLKSSGSSAADRTKQHAAMRLSLDRTTGSMPYLGWGPALDFYSDNYDGDTQRPNARIAGVISNYSAGNEGGQLRFYTTPTDTATGESDFVERIRITSGGDLEIMTAGKGISFINAADTATNETVSSSVLDDYEEGTWSPTIGGSATYDIQWGYYIRVGKLVQLWGGLRPNSMGSGDARMIQNLPYTCINSPGTTYSGGGNIVWGDNAATSYTNTPSIMVDPNANTARIGLKNGASTVLGDNFDFWQNNHRANFYICYYAKT